MADDKLELQKYRRILQFKLSRETSLADDAYRSLIISALYHKAVSSIPELNAILNQEFDIKPLPFHFVQKYLEELKDSGKVAFERGAYQLQENVRTDLQVVAEKRIQLRDLVEGNILAGVKSRVSITGKQEKELRELFNQIISLFFSSSARLFSGYLIEEDKKKLVFDLPTLEDVIDNESNHIDNLLLREAFRECVKNEIKGGTDFFYDCFYDIFQAYVCFEILSIDPELKMKTGIVHAYLDTNFLLDLLIPSRNRHNIAVDCVKLSREMGIKNRYTLLTSIELQTLIREYQTAEKLNDNVLETLGRTDTGGLIRAFFEEKRANPSLTFQGYCISLLKSFQKHLEVEYEVKLDSGKYPEVIESAKELAPLIEQSSRSCIEYKSKESIAHDAFCLQLQCLKKASIFVTSDKTLFAVSKTLIEKGKISKPLSVESNVWLSALTFIRPSYSDGTCVQAFKEFMLSPMSSSMGPISMNKLLTVAFPWIKDEYLTPEDLADIASRKFIEDRIIKPQADKTNVIVTSEELIPRMIDEKLKEKMIKLAEDNERLKSDAEAERRKAADIEGRYHDAMASPIKIKPLFILGLLCLAMTMVLVFIPLFVALNIPDYAYYSLTALTIVFIGASFFGEKVYSYLAKAR